MFTALEEWNDFTASDDGKYPSVYSEPNALHGTDSDDHILLY